MGTYQSIILLEKQQTYKIKTRTIVQSAQGNKKGHRTTVIAAAVFI